MTEDGASLIIIGTELTEGIIQDSHARFICAHLKDIGCHVNEVVAVADDNSIEKILAKLAKHNSIVIITGGLGPTSDDMTRTSIAKVAGVELYQDRDSWDRLYKRVGDRIHGANESQTWFPKGFFPVINPRGTADAFYGYAGKTLLIALPGPPREAHPLFEDEILPLLRKKLSVPEVKRDEYSTFLIPEARLEEATKEADSALTWGTRFQEFRISLYIAGGNGEERDAAIRKLSSLVGPYLIEKGDKDAFEMLEDLLLEKGKTIGTAESCTGGLLAKIFTDRAGSSRYFEGGVVSYSPSVKEKVLGVKESTVEQYGVVSEECAAEMAEGALKVLGTDYAVSITGVAGPDPSEGKEPGTVSFGIAGKGLKTLTFTLHFMSISRVAVRRRAAVAAALFARQYIAKNGVVDIPSSWLYI
jgi:competence/damage-inducible protein CinA C-terminal domain